MDIGQIDRNFAAEQVDYEGMETYHLPMAPFEIRGLFSAVPGDYKRLPDDVAGQCNDSLRAMYVCPSGGRIRFRTDSRRIILKADEPDLMPNPHHAFTGGQCFDLYSDGGFVNSFRPDTSGRGEHVRRKDLYIAHGYDAIIRFPTRKMREILIYFPLYSRVDEVWIALEKDAFSAPPTPYSLDTPFVFYGTSITQGGCVSHPGNNYPAILSRWLDSDFLNLGFSDGGRGELAMAEYISTLPMSALVLDYDANARGAEGLKQTFEPFYRTVRKRQPDVPILMVSAVSRLPGNDLEARRKVIRDIYETAVAEGDRNVRFLNGETVFAPYGGADYCTVDGLHVNDLGAYAFAKAAEPILSEMLNAKSTNA